MQHILKILNDDGSIEIDGKKIAKNFQLIWDVEVRKLRLILDQIEEDGSTSPFNMLVTVNGYSLDWKNCYGDVSLIDAVHRYLLDVQVTRNAVKGNFKFRADLNRKEMHRCTLKSPEEAIAIIFELRNRIAKTYMSKPNTKNDTTETPKKSRKSKKDEIDDFDLNEEQLPATDVNTSEDDNVSNTNEKGDDKKQRNSIK